MTDRDIIERLADITGLGVIYDRGRRVPHHKNVWEWSVVRRGCVAAVAMDLAPLLSERRRLAIGGILAYNDLQMAPAAEPAAGSPEGWAWVAGLIEGEGWTSPSPTSVSRSTIVGVESTDRDVISRLHRLTGAGRIAEIRPRKQSWKASWRWSVTSHRDMGRIITCILPLLGERRAVRASYVLKIAGV